VDDQMKLLQYSWSDLLILDHLHQRIHNRLQDETTLPNGQKFDLLSLALLGTTQFADRFHNILTKLVDLNFDVPEYICIKFVILLNPEVRQLSDRCSVRTAQEQVRQALLEYIANVHPDDTEKYQKMMDLLPELHYIADNGEKYLEVARSCISRPASQTSVRRVEKPCGDGECEVQNTILSSSTTLPRPLWLPTPQLLLWVSPPRQVVPP
ncbi:hypothetical protein Pcinc_040993, partial [Petrolisthes cinctipes]